MLFRRAFLDGIAAGVVTLAFRRWNKPAVKKGSTLKTAVGVLRIEAVAEVDPAKITVAEARKAGYAERSELLKELGARAGNAVYRMRLVRAGDDPRIALRKRSSLSETDYNALEIKLKRLDAASRCGPWTTRALETVAENPGRRAGDLADILGFEKDWLKLQIRKLKNLGLAVSLGTGYRISPRGRAWMKS